MRLLLIRHGETPHNAGQMTLGREDVPLNERGLLQAESVGESLRGEPITAIYASPLQRARSTAAPLAQALGLTVAVEDGLIEMDVGEVENLTFAELAERFPDFLKEWRSDRVADLCMPGGESLRQVQGRAWAAVEAIRERHPDELVAAVSHNFVILTVLCQVMGMDLSDFRRVRQDLGAVSVVELDAERSVLVSMNDRCHLPSKGAESKR
jgi:probable phosphoglycerate mutase